jgi:lipopolysaccharide transport system ATP-binding protein
MTPPPITAHELGKKYRVATDAARYGTLRDAIAGVGKRIFARASHVEDFWALRNVSFDVQAGDVLGVIGKNGAGKSTLLKLLARITEPTEGWAEIRGRVGSLLEVGSGFNPELTGRENIYLNGAILGMGRREIASKFDDIVAFSEIDRFLDTPVKRYSTGMHMRLAFAVAAHFEPEILLVDEVLAVGDVTFQRRCLGKMEDVARSGRTVIFVSHQMSAIKSLCNRCIVLDKGGVVFDGAPTEAVEDYLTRGADVYASGDIPPDWPRLYSTGEAYFRSARIVDDHGREVKELYYRSPFTVGLVLEVIRPINDAMIQLSVGTTEGEKVVFAQSSDSIGLLELEPGRWLLEVEISVELTPGPYSLYLALSHTDGTTIEWVERVHDFTVLHVSREVGLDYRWDEKYGYVSVRTPWRVLPAEARPRYQDTVRSSPARSGT